jgi:Uma2 family endonuclease
MGALKMMATASPPETLADLMNQLGNVSQSRIRMFPLPGTATPADVQRLCDREPKCLCELVDGVLVEKVMGYEEACLSAWLLIHLGKFVEDHDLGLVTGGDGPLRILPKQVRLPDLAFVPNDQLRQFRKPRKAVPSLIPALAVEVLSDGNTKAEMARKLKDYFDAGVKLVWYVDPPTRTVRVYRSPKSFVTKGETDELDGEDLLPGFRVSIREWFERALRVRPS